MGTSAAMALACSSVMNGSFCGIYGSFPVSLYKISSAMQEDEFIINRFGRFGKRFWKVAARKRRNAAGDLQKGSAQKARPRGAGPGLYKFWCVYETTGSFELAELNPLLNFFV